MKNCYDDMDGRLIGSYEGLKAELQDVLNQTEDEEEREDIETLLQDLEEYQDYDGQLVLDDNNGMGYSIKEGE